MDGCSPRCTPRAPPPGSRSWTTRAARASERRPLTRQPRRPDRPARPCGDGVYLVVEGLGGAGSYTLRRRSRRPPAVLPAHHQWPIPSSSSPSATLMAMGSPTSPPPTASTWGRRWDVPRPLVRPAEYPAMPSVVAMISGDFNGDGRARPGRRQPTANDVSVLLGNGDGTFQDQMTYTVGRSPRTRGGGLQRRRADRPGRRQLRLRRRVGAAGQRRRHLPGPGDVPGGVSGQLPSWRGTSTATGGPTWPSPTTTPTTCRCCWATATAPSRTRCGTRWGLGPSALVAGDFNGDGRTRPGRRQLRSTGDDASVLLGNGDGTFQDQVRYTVGDQARLPSWRGTSTATAKPTWPPPTESSDDITVLLGNGDGTFQNQVRFGVGDDPTSLVAGDFNGDGRPSGPTWPPPTTAPVTSPCCWATATAPSRTRCGSRWGGLHTAPPWWRGTSTATAGPTWPSPTLDSGDVSVLLGNGDGTFQNPVRFGVGAGPGSLVAGDFNGDGRTDLAVANYGSDDVVGVAGQRRRHLPEPGAVRGGIYADFLVAGDFNGDGKLDLVVANAVSGDVVRATGQRRRHLPDPGAVQGGGWLQVPGDGGLRRRRPDRPGRRQRRLR